MTNELSRAEISLLSSIFQKAAASGRRMLYEYEVYRILKALEIPVPTHEVVRNSSEITPELLAKFPSPRLVLKAAIDGVAHKQKAGGVRIIHKDHDFLRYTFEKMWEELNGRGFQLDSILIVEWIDYSKDLGNEVMLGFRESEAFGPVISFSKGGSDAEHFAKHFSPANLILAPIDREWAHALLYSTSIQEKYVSQGHSEYTDKIIEVGLKLSALSVAFSNFFPQQTKFILQEFEINPFIFDPFGNFIALDGYAEFAPRDHDVSLLSDIDLSSIEPFFNPTGIAVIGVSKSNPNNPGSIIASNLRRLHRQDVYCINPKGGRVEFYGKSYQLYPDLAALGKKIDLAVIAVPADAVLEALEQCSNHGVKAAILIPGGFRETGNEELEERILSLARRKDMRLIGPNCLGIIYSTNGTNRGINTFFISEKKFQFTKDRLQNVALLSQSGALGLTEIHNLRHAISPKAIVSYGNALDIGPSDLITYFSQDPEIDVIGCYIEGFKKYGGARFFKTVVRCPKPVIVYKAGRTEAGQQAAQSHTASIAGEYEISRAVMKQAGLIIADTMMDHIELIKTFALFHNFKINGNRLAIIANAGYEKTYAADQLGGLKIAEFDGQTKRALEAILPKFVVAEPLLDVTPMADDEMYERCIDIVLQSDAVDALLISIVPHAIELHTTDKEIEENRDHVAARIVRIFHKYKKPVVVSTNVTPGSDVVYNTFGQTFDGGGIPTFLTAGRAMKCLNAFIRYHMIRKTNNFGEWLKHE